jgi:molybdopterin-guanine dinucleotide biosynthesis protein A
VVADRLAIETPLAGIEAALYWASRAGADLLLTIPSDAPNLPTDLVSRLAAQAPAIAASGGQDHYLTGVWPVKLHAMLANAIERDGLRAVRDFAKLADACPVEWTGEVHDPFLNLNSPEDVASFLKGEQHHARP